MRAFSFSGRARVTVATPSTYSQRRCCQSGVRVAEPVKGLYAHVRDVLVEHVTSRGCPFASRKEPLHA